MLALKLYFNYLQPNQKGKQCKNDHSLINQFWTPFHSLHHTLHYLHHLIHFV